MTTSNDKFWSDRSDNAARVARVQVAALWALGKVDGDLDTLQRRAEAKARRIVDDERFDVGLALASNPAPKHLQMQTVNDRIRDDLPASRCECEHPACLACRDRRTAARRSAPRNPLDGLSDRDEAELTCY